MNKKSTGALSRKILENYNLALELDEKGVTQLIDDYDSILEKKPILERIKSGSILVAGDIHGDFEIMKSIISLFRDKKDIEHLIFLGDIVDRGSNSIACLNLLFALIIQYPERVHIVRGNHEALSVNSRYGFLQEVMIFQSQDEELYNPNNIPKLYVRYNKTFSNMPVAIVHEKLRFFFVHGGIPIDSCTLNEIKQLPKGDQMLKNPLIKQLLWNDPKEALDQYSSSLRGNDIYTFGSEIVSNFLQINNLKKIIRAHEAFPEGAKYFFDEQLLSLFTSEEFYNYVKAKIALINESGKIKILSPKNNNKNFFGF
ncbi:MAG: metallophosphoesterase [Candidatus Heimdallarchaeota archaeon]